MVAEKLQFSFIFFTLDCWLQNTFHKKNLNQKKKRKKKTDERLIN